MIWLIGTQLLAAIAFVLPTFFLLGQLLAEPDSAFLLLPNRSGVDPLPASYTLLLLILTLLGLPLTIFSAAYAWRLFARGQFRHASQISAVPLIYLGLSSCLLPFLVTLFLLFRP
jgi:hypothetical protein